MQEAHPIKPGFMVVQSNQMDALRDLLVEWIKGYPLAPLENDCVLAQSSGMAQWLKLALARDEQDGGCGIAAAIEFALPAQFLWKAYRSVLGAESIPAQSPLDKTALGWRLMRLLPQLTHKAEFASLKRFLENDDDLRKRQQLAERLADLFDQYQVYRADWLTDWAAGRDQLGSGKLLDEDNLWQAKLWQRLLEDAGEDALRHSRSGVHQRFMEQLQQGAERPTDLPRRVLIFGISSMPAQMLEALSELGRHCQVLLLVHNPCQYYWGDIVAGKDLLKNHYKRQKAPEFMDPHGHPLLAAWGKQGRDYMCLMDQFDDPNTYKELFVPVNDGRIDLFNNGETSTMLGQLQDDILQLRSATESRQQWPAVNPKQDFSVRFHIAHSAQREVEILHDQLLARFNAVDSLEPADVIVMVPDINAYAPFIEAVFNQFPRDDKRHIPFSLTDQKRRGYEPLLIALESLLKLPESRFAVSDILDLLDVPALRDRFGIEESALPPLKRWIEGSGIRWGLDAEQRKSLNDLPGLEQNTWLFGMQRMLLGYAAGAGYTLGEIEPYDELAGLEAAHVGSLLTLLEHLQVAHADLSQPASPQVWTARLHALLDLFFKADSAADKLLLSQLRRLLESWQAICEQTNFSEELPLNVVQEAWLADLEKGGLAGRFLGGAVSFCTLMPMRTVPFKVVCLLGMNDGDYPRRQPPLDFDLMARDYRPGDRSRREDDRYLLLEALLSAREQLYVSWVGRSIRDNSERVPSVLIGQLRDHLAACWRIEGQPDDAKELLKALTQVHPLQPFSRDYFTGQNEKGLDGLYTYSSEWRQVHEVSDSSENHEVLGAMPQEGPLSLKQLEDFLRNPVETFFKSRLKVFFNKEEETSSDQEPFSLNALEKWQVRDELLSAIKPMLDQPDDSLAINDWLQEQVARLKREGRLPLAGFAETAAVELTGELPAISARYRDLLKAWPQVQEGAVKVELAEVAGKHPALSDSLAGLRRNGANELAMIELVTSKLLKEKKFEWHNLTRHWVRHLALQLSQPCTSLLISQSGDVTLNPIEKPAAEGHLKQLLQCWAEGMREPLPVACKTACKWLEEAKKGNPDKAEDAARDAYEGDFYDGEADSSTALRRAFPDFDALTADANSVEEIRFADLAQQLYGPLIEHLTAKNVGDAK